MFYTISEYAQMDSINEFAITCLYFFYLNLKLLVHTDRTEMKLHLFVDSDSYNNSDVAPSNEYKYTNAWRT